MSIYKDLWYKYRLGLILRNLSVVYLLPFYLWKSSIGIIIMPNSNIKYII